VAQTGSMMVFMPVGARVKREFYARKDFKLKRVSHKCYLWLIGIVLLFHYKQLDSHNGLLLQLNNTMPEWLSNQCISIMSFHSK
jgi:hypothetical protein